MDTREKVIRKSIKALETRITKLEYLLAAKPLTEIIENRKVFAQLLEENQGVEKRTRKEFIEQVVKLEKREKKLFKLAEQTKDSNKLIDSLTKLQSEHSDLTTELWKIEHRKPKF